MKSILLRRFGKIPRLTLILAAAALFSSCAGRATVKTGYQTLAVSKAAFETLTDVAIHKYRIGQLTAEEIERVSTISIKYGVAHNFAEKALETFVKSRTEGNKLAFQEALRYVKEIAVELDEVFRELKINEGIGRLQ